MTEFTIGRSQGVLQALGASWRRFAVWWLGEARKMFPGLSFGWLTADQSAQLIITHAAAAVTCDLRAGAERYQTNCPADAFGSATIAGWLAGLNVASERVRVGFALDQALFFARDFTLPRGALRALPQILEQELVRRTPFDPADVWHGGEQRDDGKGRASDVIAVRHWIVRKDIVDQALRLANLANQDIDFIVVTAQENQSLAMIPLRASPATDPRWVRRAIQLLVGLAVVVVVAGFGLIAATQLQVASRLADELVEARQAVGGANGGAIAKLTMQKSQPSVLEIWDELSQLLPDSTYLTDLRISDGRVELTGLSTDAPRLVKLLGNSRLLRQVALVGAITPNTAEGKDQFKIAAVARNGERRPAASAKAEP